MVCHPSGCRSHMLVDGCSGAALQPLTGSLLLTLAVQCALRQEVQGVHWAGNMLSMQADCSRPCHKDMPAMQSCELLRMVSKNSPIE